MKLRPLFPSLIFIFLNFFCRDAIGKAKLPFANSKRVSDAVDQLLANMATSNSQTRAAPVTLDEYLSRREDLLQEEDKRMLGSHIELNDREVKVNNIIMDFKDREYAEGFDGTNGLHFAAAQHFFHVKNLIEESNVFKILKLLPKGTALHLHDTTTGSTDYVATNLTHWKNLYICVLQESNQDNVLLFRFFATTPETGCSANSNWVLVEDFRNNASSPGYVDWLFKKSMSLFTDTPERDYKDNNGAWYYFARKIDTVSGVVGYVEALKAYYYQTLQEFYDDNVSYIEMRGLLEYNYRLDQTELTPAESLAVYKEVTDRFVKDHPDFWGAKFIITPIRFYSPRKMGEIVNASIELKRLFPNFFAGFDIVAHEDLGMPNIEYISQLLEAAANDIKFFFHAGESDWHGTKIDDNILDAILLNTTRIGHGTALNGRPHLANIVYNKKIGLEVSPIGGQVLRLFEDFRTHPSVPFLREGFPIVISSDNPGMWRATGLSYDWYITFMAMAGKRADLRFLKQLALNSITYSAMSNAEKRYALQRWRVKYNQFLDEVLLRYSSPPGSNSNA